MKKFFAILMTMCIGAALHAQSMSFLKNESKISMRLNYSEANIAGFTEATILSLEEDWNKDQPVLFAKLTDEYNDKMKKKLPAGMFSDANYVIEVRPTDIRKNGTITFYFVILSNGGEEMYRSGNLKGKGGTFGSLLNLIGDGMRSTGEEIAKVVAKELKKNK